MMWNSRRNRYLWLRLTGPGRVGVQSHYEPLEDPGQMLAGSAPMTTSTDWANVPPKPPGSMF